MKFRTQIDIRPSQSRLDQQMRVFSIGSCFAEEVAERLVRVGIETLSNPLGTLYNPLSIERAIARMVERRTLVPDELSHRGNLAFSFDTHGCFDGPDGERVAAAINGAIEEGGEALRRAEWVVVTLGTAWVYEREGEVVANCHKVPAREFTRRRLAVGEVVEALERIVAMLPEKHILFTVSPIRHLADGLEGNSLSKATLRVAVDEVVGAHPERCHYFPAYEALVDDLRDYRFYGEDMVHPSRVAVEYVWELFAEAYLSPEARRSGAQFARLAEARNHRPLHPESSEYVAFRGAMRLQAEQLLRDFPNNPIASDYVAHFSDAVAGE